MKLLFDVLDSFERIEATPWDALVSADDPFLEHAFLLALEQSRSVGTVESGWLPQIICATSEDGTLVAALPLFLRGDSYGEFIFDWAWADASHRAGLPYYPKMTAAIPFTPATGRRLLIHPRYMDVHLEVAASLLKRAHALTGEMKCHSLHLLFHTEAEKAICDKAGMIARLSYQYHWQKKAHWRCFEDFLADMRAPLRKQIKKERRLAADSGLSLSMRRGSELTSEDWASLYTFYRTTVWEKGARAYLTEAFFREIQQTSSDRVVAAMAHHDGKPQAGALFFTRGKALFGRYWGTLVNVPVLHFELCYYQPIAWALSHGIERFEAGAQGEHKLRRGLLPNPCYSSHHLLHPGLRRAVREFTDHEARHVAETMSEAAKHGPFHRDPASCQT